MVQVRLAKLSLPRNITVLCVAIGARSANSLECRFRGLRIDRAFLLTPAKHLLKFACPVLRPREPVAKFFGALLYL